MKTAITALGLILYQSCDVPSEKKKSDSGHPVTHRLTPIHRFILTRYGGNDVAFDTQTGQLCKTWEWEIAGRALTDPNTGRSRQRQSGEFAPPCLTLFEKYPTDGATRPDPTESTTAINPEMSDPRPDVELPKRTMSDEELRAREDRLHSEVKEMLKRR